MLTALSLKRIDGLHPDLVAVIRRADELATATNVGFFVVEGRRTAARQLGLFNRGMSRTLHSRHITGHAVDLCPLRSPGVSDWSPAAFTPVLATVRAVAGELGVVVEFGADFPKRFHTDFVDMPHVQLPRSMYADDDLVSENHRVLEYLRTGRIP